MFAMVPNWLKNQFQGKDNYNGTHMVLVVGNDGYDYKYYQRQSQYSSSTTRGMNIHFALNGPLQLSYDEFDDFIKNITNAVSEARAELDKHETNP